MEWLADLSLKWVLIIIGLLVLARTALIRSPRRQIIGAVRELTDAGLMATVAVFLIIRPLIAQAYYIPSESMHPALREGDRILVNKLVYQIGEPRRLDIAVFHPPEGVEGKIDYVKRVIGMPGEVIEVVPQRVLVDGRTVLRLTRGSSSEVSGRNFGGGAVGFTYDISRAGSANLVDGVAVVSGGLETVKITAVRPGDRLEAGDDVVKLNGERLLDVVFGPLHISEDLRQWGGEASLRGKVFSVDDAPRLIAVEGEKVTLDDGHILINGRRLEEPYVANTPDYPMAPFTIPPRHYFMMGDNRTHSSDSHVWGPLPRERMLGRADVRFWPVPRFGKL